MKIHKKLILSLLTIFLFVTFLTGCNAMKKQQSSEPNYKEMKQLVIDILQTEDGKKAIKQTVQEKDFKKDLILNTGDVKQIIQDELLSNDNKEKLKSLYEDPEFASKLAKILKKENEKLLKDLMKDPDYRKMMVEVMKEKEFEKMLLEVMKSNAYRTQIMLVMKESLQSPMFKYDLLKLMEEASKKALKPEKDEKKS